MSVRVEPRENSNVRLSMGTIHCTHYTVSKDEAIQLAKDLLMACGQDYVVADNPVRSNGPKTASVTAFECGAEDRCNAASCCGCRRWEKWLADTFYDSPDEPHIETFSGMSLDEIQKKADDMCSMSSNISPSVTQRLAMLIANLAARVKELNLTVQSKRTIDAFKESETYRKIQEQAYSKSRWKEERVYALTCDALKLQIEAAEKAEKPPYVEPIQVVITHGGKLSQVKERLKLGNKGYVKIKGKRMFLIGVKEYKEALALLGD